MKTIKISLLLIFVATICYFLIRLDVDIDQSKEPPNSPNPFRKLILQKIDSIKTINNLNSCRNYYIEISGDIEEFHNRGHFGLYTENENGISIQKSDNIKNDQWKEIFSKSLYAEYAPRFTFRKEADALKNSSLLDKNDNLYQKLKGIEMVLNKYDEISSFIYICNQFNPQGQTHLEIKFPDPSQMLTKSRAYLKNKLDNNYVNNCFILRKGLQEIPQNLFNKNLTYLKNKIDIYGPIYSSIPDQITYLNNIYNPLKREIGELTNDTYALNGDIYFERKMSCIKN